MLIPPTPPHPTTPHPTPTPLGELADPNAIIDIMRGNCNCAVWAQKGGEIGHSCYVNVSGDRGR